MNEPDPTGDVVVEKARKLRRRHRRPRLFAHLAHVGVLGWVFILPVIGLTWLGHLASRRVGSPWPAMVGVLVGIALGAYLVWRDVRDASKPQNQDDET